jgi:hypothetical protein
VNITQNPETPITASAESQVSKEVAGLIGRYNELLKYKTDVTAELDDY